MKNIIQEYLIGLETADPGKIIRLFSDDAIIHSPLYGDMPAKDFFRDLFADTSESEITLLNVYSGLDEPALFAAHFRYRWVLKNGTVTNFECMDIFKFDRDGKINELTIIYDTHKTRDGFESLG